MLDSEEMAGKRPIFVDAFPDVKGENAYIILNFSPFMGVSGNRKDKNWAPWVEAIWSCGWKDISNTPETLLAKHGGASLSSTTGTVAGFTFGAESRTRDDSPPTHGQEQSDTMAHEHHSLVMRCPLPPEFSADESTELRLNLQVRGHEDDGREEYSGLRYERLGIPIARGSFIRHGTGPALCAIMIKPFAALLRPWVQFHLHTGFEQILVYVEENQTSWAEEALQGLPHRNKVTLVPFYFGGISDRQNRHLQASMENHCLYQARGRVEWLAHADVDEYFDLIQEPVMKPGAKPNIGEYLATLDSSTGALNVLSQFWMNEREEDNENATRLEEGDVFPCYLTCRRDGYFSRGVRSKWIGRPMLIENILGPHEVTVISDASVHVPAPETELRVNHFKLCSPNVNASKCFRTKPKGPFQRFQAPACEPDDSFVSRCTSAMQA